MKKISFILLFILSFVFSKAQVTIVNEDGTESQFDKVEIEASFPGGANAWKNYMVNNLKANTPVKNGAPIGTYQVIIKFIVSKDGTVSNAVAETKFGYGMEAEVIRIISRGPNWIPAQQNGKAVNAYRRQPVTFVVQEEGIEVLAKNTLKTGTENIVHVAVAKVNSEHTELEISNGNGTVKKSSAENKFVITPSKPGNVIVDIYVVKNGKRKRRTSAYFPAN